MNVFRSSSTDPAVNRAALQDAIAAGPVLLDGMIPTEPVQFPSGCFLGAYSPGSGLRLEYVSGPSTEHQQLLSPLAWKTGPTHDVTLRGLTLDGNKANIDWSGIPGNGAAHGVGVWGVERMRIEGCRIVNCHTDGVYVTSTHVSSSVAANSDVSVVGTDIEGCHRNGIAVISGTGVIRGCNIRNVQGTAPRAGIDFEPYASAMPMAHWLVSDVAIEDCGQGIAVSDVTSNAERGDIVAKDVWIRRATSTYGIVVGNNGWLRVIGGGVQTPGIAVGVNDGLLQMDGTLVEGAGIKLTGGSFHGLGLTISNTQGWAVYTQSGTDHVSFTDTDLVNVAQGGVHCPLAINSHVSLWGVRLLGLDVPQHFIHALHDMDVNECSILTGCRGPLRPSSTGQLIGTRNSWQ